MMFLVIIIVISHEHKYHQLKHNIIMVLKSILMSKTLLQAMTHLKMKILSSLIYLDIDQNDLYEVSKLFFSCGGKQEQI